MKRLRLLYLLLILPLIFVGCKSEDDPITPQQINEALELVKYLEANGDFINTVNCPAMISAEAVRSGDPAKQFIIDIRSQSDFENKGHIEGAKRVDLKDIVTYYRNNNLAQYEKVIIACYSGQSASYATALLRVLGFKNVYDLKFGMSAWNQNCANSWLPQVQNGNAYASQMVTTAFPKNAVGDLPVINTGKTNAAEILEARVIQLLNDGFSAATVKNNDVFTNLSNYYIVNYWPLDHYNMGHIPGAIQYTPREDFKMDKNLKTLPTNKPVVIYCYTGQTSGHVAAYLKLLGYDAKTLLFGTNAMNYDNMPGTKFSAADIKDYPYVTGP